MFRFLALLAAAAAFGSAAAARAQAPTFDRRETLRLIEQDFLREDSRVFRNRERGQTIEASLTVKGARYDLALERPSGNEFLLVIAARDGARCPGAEIVIVGTRSGRLYQGVCQGNVDVNSRRQRAYYEAELDRLLGRFHSLFAPPALSQREHS